MPRLIHHARQTAQSLRVGGVGATARMIATQARDRAARFLDRAFDLRYGVHTTGQVPLYRADAPALLNPHYFDYQPTPVRTVRTVLRRLGPDVDSSTFIDFGSGRGRVLLLASELGFRQVIGGRVQRPPPSDRERQHPRLPRASALCGCDVGAWPGRGVRPAPGRSGPLFLSRLRPEHPRARADPRGERVSRTPPPDPAGVLSPQSSRSGRELLRISPTPRRAAALRHCQGVLGFPRWRGSGIRHRHLPGERCRRGQTALDCLKRGTADDRSLTPGLFRQRSSCPRTTSARS